MNNPTAPLNNIIVQIDKKFKDEIQLESGLKLFQDTTFRPEWHVTITGRVVSVPKKVDDFGWLARPKIKQQVEVGDEISFCYLVIFDIMDKDDGDSVYYEEIPTNPFITTYSNKSGHLIIVRYRVADDKFDVALCSDTGVIYDKKEKLTLLEKENYLGNFKFAETNVISYNNLIELEGQEFWTVDYGHVIAIKKGNQLIAASGRAILSVPELTQSDSEEAGIILPDNQNYFHQAASKVIALGDPLEGAEYLPIEPGDRVLYDKRYAEQYELWGSPVLVLPHKRLLAKV